MNSTRQPIQEACQRKMIWRWDSFSPANASQSEAKLGYHHTEHPNSLPASYCFPGQHKGVVSRVCFTSARPARFRSGMRPSQLCRARLSQHCSALSTAIALCLGLFTAVPCRAFYNASTGRWLSRDPLGEPGFEAVRGRAASGSAGEPNACLFAANNPPNRFDVLGLFGDGGGGPGTDNSGHADFDNVSKCRFDYTAEDGGLTSSALKPERHFRDLPVSQRDVDSAIGSCDSDAFQRAMHRGQDFYSHWNKGFRWDPGNKSLPSNGYGHLGANPDPDRDAVAWSAANAWSAGNLARWRQNCCLRCKAHWWQSSCKWIKRPSGACAPDSP